MVSVIVRGRQRFPGGADVDIEIGADALKNLLVSQGMPLYAETARRGGGYNVSLSSGVAPLVAVPTTVAALEAYNNHATKVMVVRDLYAFRLLGTAAAQTWSLWGMVTTAKAVPTLSALNVYSTEGKPIVAPTADSEIVTGVGTTVVANGWRPYGAPVGYITEAAVPNAAMSVEISGRLIVPKKCSLCLHVVGATTAGTLTVGFSFDWVTMTVDT